VWHNQPMRNPRVSIIAAIGQHNELGKQNELIWRISEDLKRVKQLTMGHPLIMGRHTYESIGRPLPGRTNIIVSHSVKDIEGCLVFNSLHKAIDAARMIDAEEIFIFGGARIYSEALPHVDRLYLTQIERTDPDADAYFPDFSAFSKIIAEEAHLDAVLPFAWRTLERGQ
jgi:dihydrofolate reductase